jgi:lysophospholipase L1-like esterase
MLECLILGDSIAVGTQMFKPECEMIAKGGINSYQWINKNINKSPYSAKTVIISLGTNDHKYVKTESELRTIRKLTKADRVYWILPKKNLSAGGVDIRTVQDIVYKIAQENGDTVLPISSTQPDGIHPSWAGYKEIAEKTK